MHSLICVRMITGLSRAKMWLFAFQAVGIKMYTLLLEQLGLIYEPNQTIIQRTQRKTDSISDGGLSGIGLHGGIGLHCG